MIIPTVNSLFSVVLFFPLLRRVGVVLVDLLSQVDMGWNTLRPNTALDRRQMWLIDLQWIVMTYFSWCYEWLSPKSTLLFYLGGSEWNPKKRVPLILPYVSSVLSLLLMKMVHAPTWRFAWHKATGVNHGQPGDDGPWSSVRLIVMRVSTFSLGLFEIVQIIYKIKFSIQIIH